MNFDLSDDTKMLRDEARRFLAQRCGAAAAHRTLADPDNFPIDVWNELAALGWLGAGMPEAHGGAGLDAEGLCVLAEEFGRAVAPLPFLSSALLATDAVLRFGDDRQLSQVLPQLAAGTLRGCLALSESQAGPAIAKPATVYRDGRLDGEKLPVRDGLVAHFAIVSATDESRGVPGLYLVHLAQGGVSRERIKTLDPAMRHVRILFQSAEAEPLPGATDGHAICHLMDRAAIVTAFEQVGGASAALEMACEYARQRQAFGRAIGSFQAIKHKLANVYAALELARSHAYYAAWALDHEAPDLPLAAAAVRVAASHAYEQAAQENVQTHGGIGFTWEADPQLHYRRAKSLSLELGSPIHWKQRLAAKLDESVKA